MNKEKRRIAKRKVKPISHQALNSVSHAPAEPLPTPVQYSGSIRGLAYFIISLVISGSLLAYGFGLYLLIWILVSLLLSELVACGEGVLSTWKMALSDDMAIGDKLVGLLGLFVVTYISVMKLPIVLVLFYLRKWSAQIGRHFGRQT
jgi:hypothetical protein